MWCALGWLAGFFAAALITFVLTLAVKWAVYLIRVVWRRHGR